LLFAFSWSAEHHDDHDVCFFLTWWSSNCEYNEISGRRIFLSSPHICWLSCAWQLVSRAWYACFLLL
jgi:hypothetical protein